MNTVVCPGCGRAFKGERGLRAHQTARFTAMGCRPLAQKPKHTMVTESGRALALPDDLDPERVAGLDEAGRIVVDDFDARNPENRGITYTDWRGNPRTDPPFMFGLTLCCNASDKGVEDGIVCRGCYDTRDIGNYIHREPDGSFPGLDPVKEITS